MFFRENGWNLECPSILSQFYSKPTLPIKFLDLYPDGVSSPPDGPAHKNL